MVYGLNFGELSRQIQGAFNKIADEHITHHYGVNAKLASLGEHTDAVIPENPIDPENKHQISNMA